jgi:hypothetical protein
MSPDPTAFARCFADVWSRVDNMWRLNLLLIRVPGLKRSPEVVAHAKACLDGHELRGVRQLHHHAVTRRDAEREQARTSRVAAGCRSAYVQRRSPFRGAFARIK